MLVFSRHPPLRYIGKISYGIYLWHYPVILGLMGLLTLDPTLIFVLSLLGTLFVASISWFLVEQPISKRFHGRLKATKTQGSVDPPVGVDTFS